MNDFEDWEIYADFYDRQDWPGLVVYCKKEVSLDPTDLHAAERLVGAYQNNGDYEEAIEFAVRIHNSISVNSKSMLWQRYNARACQSACTISRSLRSLS